MIYDQVRELSGGGFALRSRSNPTRLILVPLGADRDAPQRILQIEQQICADLRLANNLPRESSRTIHGVQLRAGQGEADFLLYNDFSGEEKAIIRAVAHPALPDADFLCGLLREAAAPDRLLLISESEFSDYSRTANLPDQLNLQRREAIKNTELDRFGWFVDYFRATFAEPLKYKRTRTRF